MVVRQLHRQISLHIGRRKKLHTDHCEILLETLQALYQYEDVSKCNHITTILYRPINMFDWLNVCLKTKLLAKYLPTV